MKKIISNQAPKGMADWLPDEFAVRQYIFDTWTKVCQAYGFEQYLTPMMENADIYRIKSGDDVGNKELMILTDRAGRELALRPEMTPSITRVVSRIYDQSPKPLKLFSIANFIRNEKPQRGRNREFWQLNCDIFGSNSLQADIEVMQLALDIMLAFQPPKDSFVLYINNRKLLNDLLLLVKIKTSLHLETVRLLDKWNKLSSIELKKYAMSIGLKSSELKVLEKFISSKDEKQLIQALPELKASEGFSETAQIITNLAQRGYRDYVSFNPSIIRGFDYYDGPVFELFDKHPENNRAMFGGGRYNGLAEIFGKQSFPAVGFAPGDETTKLFLESWGLLDNLKKADKYYLPILDLNLEKDYQKLATKLRQQNYNLETGLSEQKLNKALEYANKKGINQVIILAEREKAKKIYKIKDMQTGKEKTTKF